MPRESLVRLWSQSGYRRRAARHRTDLDTFAAAVRERFGFELPDDYRRFLALTDGGQYDHAILHGVGDHEPWIDDALVIGGSGNVDAYVLRAGGGADIVNLFDLNEVVESFPSFTALLDRLLTGAAP